MFNKIRSFISLCRASAAPVISFIAAGGLLTSGWYGLLQALTAGVLSFMMPAIGLSVMSAAWWFPFVRWAYAKYVYTLAPTLLPTPDSLKYALNPPALLKAGMCLAVWFYTPLVQNSWVRILWSSLKSTPAPVNEESLAFTERQFQKAERNEPLESSHDVPYPLQQAATKVAEEIKTAKSKAEAVYGAAAQAVKQEGAKQAANKKSTETSEAKDDDDDEKDNTTAEEKVRSRKNTASVDKNKPTHKESAQPSAPSELYAQ